MIISFKTRAIDEEIMDDLDMSGPVLHKALDQLEVVNRWLGGNQLSIRGIRQILKNRPNTAPKSPIKILDLGCGGGDGLRAIADWGRKNGIPLQLCGLDANAYTVEYARQRSTDYNEIQYQQVNVLDASFDPKGYDIILCALFLHHFDGSELDQLLNRLNQSGAYLLINDLHRHWLAYYLFYLVCFVFQASDMTREDGLLSVRKGFRKTEWTTMLKRHNINNYKLQWKWAFRHLLIILNGT